MPENFQKATIPVLLDLRKTPVEKSHDFRAVIVSKSSVLRGLFVSVQMFSYDIFPYLNCFNLFETNGTQSG